ncbi:large subunit ribosomal protein L17 [Cyclobacterium lianum]|uniref:Large ribosomal subunit protein bL17 n=1 Tax=Cyclobacterium lianum TaxID=388280 RepID=A0A1M7PKW3_9BACT|nr:50S ribosomal protein L17 [Cyclobacterium lianum]SHN17862.1 large subunit ribosomal protein L17 [Cyclobacterium lianum]
MRHGKKFNHLGRTASHRKAMLSNMAMSLLEHKRITTTLAKAKELRKYIEPLITKAKEDTTHNRRVAFGYLKNKEAIKILFGEVVEKIGNRPGGYTRIIKTGFRLGDNAEMCIIELVDYNELLLKEDQPVKKSGRRRSRRGSGKGSDSANVPVAEEVKEEEKPKSGKKAKDTEEAKASEDAEKKPADSAPESPEASAEEDSDKKDEDKKSE